MASSIGSAQQGVSGRRANSSGDWIPDDGRAVTIADQATPTYSAYLKKSGTGAGQTKKLPNQENLVFDSALWLADGRDVVMFDTIG